VCPFKKSIEFCQAPRAIVDARNAKVTNKTEQKEP
jgi:hypothetical protein